MRFPKCGAIVCALIGSWSAHAVTVQYTAINLGGAAWRYDYSVANDTLVDPGLPDDVFVDFLALAEQAVVGGAS